MQIISFAIWRQRFPKFKGIVSANYLSTCCSKSSIATQSIGDDLLEILEEILSYGIGGLFTPLNLFLFCLTGVCQTYPGM